jgi:hypothetical protein
MKKSLKTVLICTSSIMAVAAIAQQEPGSSGSPGSITPAAPGASQGQHEWRASKAIGAEVKDAQGQKLGKVSDIILNSSNGRIDFAVLDWNDKLVPVPYSLLTPQASQGRPGLFSPTGPEYSFTANVDTTKLQTAPTIDKSRWTDIQQPGWSQKVYSHFGVQPGMGGMGSPGMGTEKNSGSGMEQPGKGTDQDKPGSGSSPGGAGEGSGGAQ